MNKSTIFRVRLGGASIRASGILIALIASIAAMAADRRRVFAAEANCSATPELAVSGYIRSTSADAGGPKNLDPAFRIHHIGRDAFSGRRWAWIETCRAPEKPWIVVRLPRTKDDLLPTHSEMHVSEPFLGERNIGSVEIRPGEIVDISHEQDAMSVHVSGKALTSGRRGEKIQVLVKALSGSAILEAEVAGPGMVRLMF